VVSQNREQLLEVTVSFNNTRSRDAKRRDEVSHSSEVKAGAAADLAGVALAAISGTFNAAHPDPAHR
jgi:hypothetical protein